jgi:hypothetical protein
MDFLDLFFNRKSDGPGSRCMDREAWLGSTVDRGNVDKRVRQRRVDARRVGARPRQCSPAAMEEDESTEAVLKGCSPEHEWQWRGGTTEAENGRGMSSA